MSTIDTTSPYALDNDASTAPQTLACLATILDGFTVQRLGQAGVRQGARCLELGAGNGSVAGWLADQVGPAGEVVAVDIKPQHVRPHERVTVVGANVVTDPLPPGEYDVIHARLLLAHLPTRLDVLTGCADRLAPGGALVVEEWGNSGAPGILDCRELDDVDLYGRYVQALLALFASRGNNTRGFEQVAGEMRAAGLVDVTVEAHARTWRGGTAGCQLPILVSTELQDRLLRYGVTAADLDRMRATLEDPQTLLMGNVTWSTIGRRAA